MSASEQSIVVAIYKPLHTGTLHPLHSLGVPMMTT